MKKALSIALAAAFALCALGSLALAPKPPALQDPFVLSSFYVTNADGYVTPYRAYDNPYAINDNELVFISLKGSLRGADPDSSIGSLSASSPVREIVITSDSLDLSISKGTFVSQTISAADVVGSKTSPASGLTAQYDAEKNKLTLSLNLLDPCFTPYPQKGKRIEYNLSFLAGVKPTGGSGEIKASMTIGSIVFATDGSLHMYSGNTLKYIVASTDPEIDGYVNTYAIKDSDANELFTLNFDPIGQHTFQKLTYKGNDVKRTFDGKLIGKDAVGVEVNLTETVSAAFAYLGLNFAYSNYVPKSYFERVSSGNPVVLTDGFNFVTASVSDPDTEMVAETGDASGSVLAVAMIGALLALFAAVAARKLTSH